VALAMAVEARIAIDNRVFMFLLLVFVVVLDHVAGNGR
jgi:hypothetical protein